MKPLVFYMYFALEEENEDGEVLSITYGFNISPKGNELLQPLLYPGDLYEEVTSEIEENFGVHDVTGSGLSDVVDSIGYTSYEIQDDNIILCMQDWYKKMSELVGVENITSKIINCGNTDELSDEEIYNKIKELDKIKITKQI